jgi:heme A synthase
MSPALAIGLVFGLVLLVLLVVPLLALVSRLSRARGNRWLAYYMLALVLVLLMVVLYV